MASIGTRLAALLGSVRRPGDFFAAGTEMLGAPSIEVEGVGPVALPLLPVQIKPLLRVATPAPYGRGTETLVDSAVRRCWQIGPERVRLGGRSWERTLASIVARAAEGLGVADPVTAAFYKLLLYDQGGFFVGHRDTEKAAGMFATLIVALPSIFAGGDLLIRHKGREARLDLQAEAGEVAFAAFYADCLHEVLPVAEGCRLVLVYNLLRVGKKNPPEPPDYAKEQDQVATLFEEWRKDEDRPVKLVFPLEHAYTPAEFGFAALKGADRAVAGVLAAAAQRSMTDLYLAALTVEESGAAEYVERSGWRRGEEDEFEAGELFDRSVTLSDWRRSDGGTTVLGEIPVKEDELSPPDALEDLDPDEEHFQEATGNEGASYERTYRRAALVLWPEGRLFAVLVQAGLAVTLPFLEAEIAALEASPGEDWTALRQRAQKLATEIVAAWPNMVQGWNDPDHPTETARMLGLLTRLEDAAGIARLLERGLADRGFVPGDAEAIVASLEPLSPPQRPRLIERIVRGMADEHLETAGRLLAMAAKVGMTGLNDAAKHLLAALPGDPARAPARHSWGPEPRVRPSFVVDLLAGLAAIDQEIAAAAVEHLLAWPKTYDMDLVLVPALRALTEGDIRREGPASAPLIAACRAHLARRIAEPLQPPADGRRESTVGCRCTHCIALARFLADPFEKSWTLRAAESVRRHVAETIRRAEADVDTVTDRRGRPYSLVCMKNQASYERRVRQRAQDLADLARLDG
ncbi:MAG: 2OG-Fe(II) oxygenase [Rhodospirillales bacterium]|nr:2OG-Fe(II) oxygenase [Rhodospirillales bacterium]